MPMNFEKFEYKSPDKKQLTYDYILKYFDQYVKLFENLPDNNEPLNRIIKNAYALKELRDILKELEKIKIEKLNSENEYISLKTSCRWLALGNPQISLNHFATLGAQIVTRVEMVLGEVIKNLKTFLSLDKTDTLNREIISSKLQTADSFEDTNYKILSCHINGEVAKYFSEENIKLPIDSENRIESLLNNKIIMNCVELYEIAKDTATSYDKAVKNGDMQKFIEDITRFFKNGYNKKRATISQVFSNIAKRKLPEQRSDNSKELSASATTVDTVVDILRFLASKHEDKLTTDSDLGELFVFANDWLLRSGKKTSDVETNTILNKLRLNRQIKEIFSTHTTCDTDDAPTEKKKGTWLRRISKKIKKLLKFRKTFVKLWSSEDNKSDSETSSMELGDAVKRLKKLVNYPPNN